jgi:hypothetical protein
MAAFEQVQSSGGEAARTVMVLSTADEDGHTTMYASATEPMDRMVHIWGADRPAVPIFFSRQMAARFSILEAFAVADQGLSEEEAEAWAWKKLREPKTAEPKQ